MSEVTKNQNRSSIVDTSFFFKNFDALFDNYILIYMYVDLIDRKPTFLLFYCLFLNDNVNL